MHLLSARSLAVVRVASALAGLSMLGIGLQSCQRQTHVLWWRWSDSERVAVVSRVESSRGHVVLERYQLTTPNEYCLSRHFQLFAMPAPHGYWPLLHFRIHPGRVELLGFGYVSMAGKPPEAGTNRAVSFPHWFLATMMGIPAELWLLQCWRHRQRRLRAACVACGYDLRASPVVCPECGTSAERSRVRLLSRTALTTWAALCAAWPLLVCCLAPSLIPDRAAPISRNTTGKPASVAPARTTPALQSHDAVPELFARDADVRLRAALKHAKAGNYKVDIVSSAMAYTDSLRPLRMLGPSVPGRVYGELTGRMAGKAAQVIAIFGEGHQNDPVVRGAIRTLGSGQYSDWKYLGRLLEAVVTPEPPSPEMLRGLEADYAKLLSADNPWRDHPGAADSILIWAAFSNTRARGLDLARQVIKEWPAPTGGVAPTRVRFAALAMGIAARRVPLLPADVALLETVLKAPGDPQQCLGATAATILWLVDGAGAGRLDAALELWGTVEWGKVQRYAATLLCDNVLDEKHVPAILARAADSAAPCAVRRGAVRLLGYLGPADPTVEVAFAKMLASGSNEVLDSIPRCLDESGSLLRVAKNRLASEPPGPGSDQLKHAVECLSR